MTKEQQYQTALEIVKLQDRINETKKNNKHARLKCNLTKIKALSKITAAITSIPLIGTFITCSAGWNPFKLNDEEVPALITTTIDREGNIAEQKEYKKDNENNILSYYTAWEQTKNNNYTRKKYKYSYSITTEEELKELKKIIISLNSSTDLTKERIEEFFKGIRNGYENQYIISMPENNTSYIEFTMTKIDNSDLITVKEDEKEHSEKGVLIMILGITLMSGELAFLGYKGFFKKIKQELEAKPHYINTKKLEQQLKAKQMLFEYIPYGELPQEEQKVLIKK